MNERDVFIAARQLESAEQRRAYLDGACAGDAPLRRRVDELLQADDLAGSFLYDGSGAYLPTLAERPIAESPGSVIGPYKLLEQIGEGGFGVVFMAEQTAPVKRKVALKVIKPGMDTRQVIGRFEAERQALALMDHPHIAKVLDAGATQTGRPFFVMELVKGLPITEYCDHRKLSPRERLELFLDVCHAVQHAHQKGIIHRDLKPSNVMVADYDDQAVPKIIDFGIAKAIGGKLTERTMFTQYGQLVGTLAYMSPEQAKFNQLDIDTRSDVYSLGVLLYELLTGTTPLGDGRFHAAPLDEMLRMIRDEESPPPSARLTTIDNLAAVAANRHTEEARLGKVVRGELDWIVMKCLEKDRARRYGSAADLSRDIQHYLRDEPIAACPPSKWYRVRKLARKHRGLFLTGTASVLGVLAVVALLVISNSRIRQEQARTGAQKVRADRARVLAETRAEEVRQGLERLKAANAWLERGRWSAEKEQWNEADAAFTKAIELRPEHVAVWIERADLFAQLGLWDLASADFAREFALWEPDTTMRWYRHALLRLSLGDVDGYRQIRTRMRERFRGTVDTHFALETVRASVLGEDPDDVEQLVELAQQCADRAPGNWHELYLLGLAQYRAGSFEESALALRQSLTGLPDWRGRSISYPVLAMAQLQLGNTDDARKSLQSAADAIDRWTQEMYEPPGRRGWAVNQGAAAVWPIVWWDWLECQIYYREAKTLIDGSPPPDDPRLRILHARSLAGLHRNFTADAEYADIVKRWPDDKQFRLEAHRCAGYSAVERREWRTVAAEFASASDLLLADSYLWRFRAIAALAAGDLVTYRQDCAAMLERFAETDDPETAGNVLLVCVLRDDALADMTRLLPLTSVADPLWHWGAWARGATLYRAGRYEESINSFEDASVMYRRNAWDWSFLAMAHHRLGHVDEARRCAREAQRWIAEANRKKPDDFSGTKPAWGGWHEPVVFPLLLREAEELLKTNNDSPTQSADEAAAATGFDG